MVRITRATTYLVGNPWKNWLLLRLDTDQPGLYGLGEGTLNAFGRTVEAAIHELAPRYEGMDPFQVETIVQRMTRDLYSDGGQIHGNAVAAVEEACWDIIGKETGRPVYDLIGGRYHESLPVYANGWYTGERTPDAFAARAAEVVGMGYRALKLDPCGAAWRVMPPAERALSLEIVRRVREAVGPEVQIMIEGHSRFSVAEAVWVGERLAEVEPAWFEEPTAHQKISSTAEVARRVPVPVATGESFTSPQQFAELLAHDTVHILQPDPGNMGGIWRTRQVCAMADAHYAVVAPHQAQGPICTAVCVQLGAAIPNLMVQELFDEFNVDWEREIVLPPRWRCATGGSSCQTIQDSASTSTGARSRSTHTRRRTSCPCSRPVGSDASATREVVDDRRARRRPGDRDTLRRERSGRPSVADAGRRRAARGRRRWSAGARTRR
ncbi:MAG TPA: mandelate racemase/muconate lactonizing enzyme family protein [Thermomicrobiales bacterium]|nr:mandelate racemase/muconate lactonizing enzyme family protein [Thermomicrobiales bacterium]